MFSRRVLSEVRNVNKTKVENSAANLTLLKAPPPHANPKSQQIKACLDGKLFGQFLLMRISKWTREMDVSTDHKLNWPSFRYYRNKQRAATLRWMRSFAPTKNGELCICWWRCCLLFSFPPASMKVKHAGRNNKRETVICNKNKQCTKTLEMVAWIAKQTEYN